MNPACTAQIILDSHTLRVWNINVTFKWYKISIL